MRSILLLICISTFSCTNNNTSTSTKLSQHYSILASENFATTISNADKSCLHYKGKPLLSFGQNVNLFDTNFSFRYDSNGSYQDFHSQGITDYLSLDEFYSIKLSTGTIKGSLNFSTDKKNRVFELSAIFDIDTDLVDTSGMEIMNYLKSKYFPCLPEDFKGNQFYELKNKNFVELFSLFPAPDTSDLENGSNIHWSLNYSIYSTKKNGL